jgi:histone-lysine N-methyltransferase SETMAR
MTKAAIQELDLENRPHPPYSPDLAPSDCRLFRSLSNNLCGAEFPSTTALSSRIGSTNYLWPNRRISSSMGSKAA